MKEFCPKCMKEREFEETLEDLDETTGILVKALICTKCGESLTDAKEFERAQKELQEKNILKIQRSIIKIGNSFGLRLPAEVVAAAKVSNRKIVDIYSRPRKFFGSNRGLIDSKPWKIPELLYWFAICR